MQRMAAQQDAVEGWFSVQARRCQEIAVLFLWHQAQPAMVEEVALQ